MKISRKAFAAALAFTGTVAVGVLPAVVGVPWLGVALSVLVAAGAGWQSRALASRMLEELPELPEAVRDRKRRQIARLVITAGVYHAGWVAVFESRPDLWFAWLPVAYVGGVLEWEIARQYERHVRRQAQRERERAERRELARQQAEIEQAQAQAEEAQQAENDKTLALFLEALEICGLGWLEVLDWQPIGEGVGVVYTLLTPPEGTSGNKRKSRRAAKFDPVDSREPIAIAMSRVLSRGQQRVLLHSTWVQITKKPQAGMYTVAIVTRDIVKEVIPYRLDSSRISIQEPMLAGYRLDGSPRYKALRQHTKIVGGSRSGKSSEVNLERVHTVRATDAERWICGVEKVWDSVANWLEPFEGTGRKIPFDWIANGPRHTAEMLAAGMRVARWRQSLRPAQKHGLKTLIIELDESSDALTHPDCRAEYMGVEYHGSELAAKLIKGAGGGDAWLVLVGQRGTIDQFGDDGGVVDAGLTSRSCFKTDDDQEVYRTTGNGQLEMPQHPGEHWIKEGGEVDKIKSPYIQEVDPQREVLHDGQTLCDIAWELRDCEPALDEGSQQAAGPVYAARSQYMTEDFYRYLSASADGPIAVEAPDVSMAPLPRPSERAEIDAKAEIRALLAQAPAAEDEGEPAGAEAGPVEEPEPAAAGSVSAGAEPLEFAEPGSPVSVLTERRSRAERVVEIVRERGRIPKAEIRAALAEQGDEVGEQVLTNLLTKAVRDGLLERPETGLYAAS